MPDVVALSKVLARFLCEEKEELLIICVPVFSHHRITTNIGFFFPINSISCDSLISAEGYLSLNLIIRLHCNLPLCS